METNPCFLFFYMDDSYPSSKIYEKIWAIGGIFKWEKNILLTVPINTDIFA